MEEELSKNKIPNCITADIFGTLLCMELPEARDNYLNLKMLADCRALLRPTPQMIAQFNIELDSAYKRGDKDLTEEKFLFLRSHPIVRNKLLDVTTGDYSQFTSNTWREVYNAIESHAIYKGELKYNAEKEDHNKTKDALNEANQKIANINEEIKEKEDAIVKQKQKYASILSTIITALIFGIPYVLASVVIIFIQNEYITYTRKGIIFIAITVVLALMISFLFKK